jgi:hypothetical protein
MTSPAQSGGTRAIHTRASRVPLGLDRVSGRAGQLPGFAVRIRENSRGLRARCRDDLLAFAAPGGHALLAQPLHQLLDTRRRERGFRHGVRESAR